MTPEQLEQIKARAEKATEGPWFADGEPYSRIVWQDDSENRVCFMAHSNGLDDERDIATSDFVAHSRQDIPDLIVAHETLERRLIDVSASLAAAISLLERGGKAAKKAAPSDNMFDQMIVDYKAALDRAHQMIMEARS